MKYLKILGIFCLVSLFSTYGISQATSNQLVSKDQAKTILKEQLDKSTDRFEIKFLENVAQELKSNRSLAQILDNIEEKIKRTYPAASDSMREKIQNILTQN